mmetsp:Transcript_9113/g.17375  ORF Transcript_9113/g.17375 Transcript_9113/m.17375 type:complete len:102 (+) Transcript_9113:896-1201(+)
MRARARSPEGREDHTTKDTRDEGGGGGALFQGGATHAMHTHTHTHTHTKSTKQTPPMCDEGVCDVLVLGPERRRGGEGILRVWRWPPMTAPHGKPFVDVGG